MMRLMVLYGRPDDTEDFDKHYREVHIPLAKTLPGLIRYTVSAGVSVVGGQDPSYLVAELDFADPAALQAALGSDVGKAATADLANLSSGGVRTLVFEVAEV